MLAALNIMKKRLINKDTGFTLIELLVVVLIIGILAAIAVPIYLNIQNGAHRAVLRSDVNRTVRNAELALTKDVALANVVDNADNADANAKYKNFSNKGQGESLFICRSGVPGADPLTNFSVVGTMSKAKGAAVDFTYAYDSYRKAYGYTDTAATSCVLPASILNGDPGNGSNPSDSPSTDPSTSPSTDPSTSPSTDPSTDPSNPIPVGGGTVCPVQDDSLAQLSQNSDVDNLPTTGLSYTRLINETAIDLNDDQWNTFNTQASVMKRFGDWYKTYSAAHVQTLNISYMNQVQDAAGNEDFYVGNSNYGYGQGADDPEGNSDAKYKVRVYDFRTGYSFDVYLGESGSVQDFTIEWNYDVSTADVQTANASTHSDRGILNTDGNQTTGIYRNVTGDNGDSWNEYAPACGQSQKFGEGRKPVNPGPDNITDPGPKETPTTTPTADNTLTLPLSGWTYSFNGPADLDLVRWNNTPYKYEHYDYPGMCQDMVDDFAKTGTHGTPFTLQDCEAINGDRVGTQLVMETVVKGSQVANSSQMEVTGDYDWLNGYYDCSAGDGVHKTEGALLTHEMHLYDTANYSTIGSDVGEVNAGDFWWMSTYVQCNTTTKVAQIRVTLTYPQDASVRNHDMYTGYFYRDGKQYSLDFPGEHNFGDNRAAFEPVWNQNAAWER